MSKHEFEALVSHLHVVGGRVVSAPPSGALVQLAPRSAPRSRERDAFFVITIPDGQHITKAVFYEQMARWAAERYFEGQGGVTAGLQRVLASLNDNLVQHNARHPEQPFYAHMVCLVLRQQEVYIAKTDGAVALLWQHGGMRSFPSVAGGPVKGEFPLGRVSQPKFDIVRYIVEAGDILAVGGKNLFEAPAPELQVAGRRGDVQGTIRRLKELNYQAVSAMVLQFVPPHVAGQAAAPSLAADTAPAPGEAQQPGEAAAAPVESIEPRGAPSPDAVSHSGHVTPMNVQPEKSPLLQRASGVLERGKAGGEVLVEAAAAARPALESIQAESHNIFLRVGQRILRLLQRGILKLTDGLRAFQRMLDKLLPEPEEGKPPSLPTPVAAAATLLIPVVVVLLVVAVSINSRDETAFERCLSQAREAAGAAALIEQSNPERAQESWFGVIEVANRCLPRRPNDPVLLGIREQAQLRLDTYAQVVRCPVTPLQRYSPGTLLRGPLLRNDVDLYVLDTTRSVIYREKLNDVGNAVIGDSEVIAARGSQYGGITIRDLIDMAWLTEFGVTRGSALVALDKTGALLIFSPTFPPATAQALVGADRWINPVAIETWQGRLYVLDSVANQIWRYQPSGGAFPSAPEEYFVGDNRPDISTAIDIAIDQTGNVYLLHRDGSVSKYNSGEEEFFQFSNLPNGGVGGLGSATTMFLDTGLISPGFYVLDAGTQVVYETTLGGTFIQSYRAPLGVNWRDLGGVAVDSVAENMYIGTREVLYHIQKCR